MMRLTSLAIAFGAWGFTLPAALAGPVGGNVTAGTASIRTNGTQTDIVQTSSRAVIDWKQFNIGSAESVHFRQPDARSVTLNRVTGGDPSLILGSVTATGQLLLLNPNGVLFGRDARVDTAGLIVSTAKLGAEDFMAGRLNFTASDRTGGSIVNQGMITVHEGGLAAMVAPHVRNEGVIQAHLGRVILASGASFAVDMAGDGLMSLAVREADVNGLTDVNGRSVATLVENTGSLIARSGSVVVMTPAFAGKLIDNAINLDGVVRADTVQQDKAGAILLSSANGEVSLAGEMAAPGGSFTMRRDVPLLGITGETAAALGRILRSGTDLNIESTGHIDVTSRLDGRGEKSGAGLRLSGASVGIREDIYTQDGSVTITASAGHTEMSRQSANSKVIQIVPDRSWPVIMTGTGDIRLEASGNVFAAHLVTRGDVFIESVKGNVNVISSLGGDLDGTSPLRSLTIRALGKPDSRDTGNVSELYDVQVAAGGRVDIAASRNIQIFATGDERPGLVSAREGVEGRRLRLSSERLGSGNLVTDTYYWKGISSQVRHAEQKKSPVDAIGRWTDLRLTGKEPSNPTAGAPPGPTNVLADLPSSNNRATLLSAAPVGRPEIRDVLPGSSTVVKTGAGAVEPGVASADALVSSDEGYSASRGVAQLADTGRARSTSAPKDIFSLADHVVEVQPCSMTNIGGATYFGRGVFGQALAVTCR